MTHIGNGSGRPYHSELRARQAAETRARILDATMRVMANGLATVSVPAVAREAGVSVPTVYRHFATKHDLLAAVYPHLMGRVGLEVPVGPRSFDDLRDGVRAIFERVDRVASSDDLARAAMVSPASEEARRISMPDRLERSRRLVDSIEAEVSPVDRDRIARLLVVLTTSSSLRVWRDHLGCSVDEAADDVEWVVRSVVATATRRP